MITISRRIKLPSLPYAEALSEKACNSSKVLEGFLNDWETSRSSHLCQKASRILASIICRKPLSSSLILQVDLQIFDWNALKCHLYTCNDILSSIPLTKQPSPTVVVWGYLNAFCLATFQRCRPIAESIARVKAAKKTKSTNSGGFFQPCSKSASIFS